VNLFGSEGLFSLFPSTPGWIDAILRSAKWGYADTPRRLASFVGHLAHECNGFTVFEENLNYSAERLCTVWPKRFPSIKSAQPYARNPEALANKVYANRLGNGDEATGDGWYFRGRGPIQITGFTNYKAAGEAIGVDLIAAPEKLLVPAIGIASAGWYWSTRNLNELADRDDQEAITRAINGGLNGLEDRKAWVKKIYEALA
jgi:putative chitinase